ncbi:MAG: type II toxin-antitoxin system prevent-host-death family antitoxin [Trueperaceae bacterium]
MEVTYSAARRSFAELLERAARGERITITRRGRPVAELGPTSELPTLDLEHLATVRGKVSEVPVDNGVLLARDEERY